MPETTDNPLGYWESTRIHELHEQFLDSMGSYWHDWRSIDPDQLRNSNARQFKDKLKDIIAAEYGDAPLIFIKDPRICRLLPFWLSALQELDIDPLAILPLRNPLEVALSLHQRDNFSSSKSYLLWLRHVLEAEYFSRQLPRMFVQYDKLLSNWRAHLFPRIAKIGIAWPELAQSTKLEIDRFLSSEFRRQNATISDLTAHPDVTSWVVQTYDVLLELAEDDRNPRLLRKIDAIRAVFNEASRSFSDVLRAEGLAVERLRALTERLREEERGRQVRIAELESHALERETVIARMSEEQQLRDAKILEQQARIAELENHMRERETVIAQMSEEQQLRNAELQLIKTSASWRFTEPFRRVGFIFSRLAGRNSPQKFRAVLRHPFSSPKRKTYRETASEAWYPSERSGGRLGGLHLVNSRALLRHPFSPSKRKAYREHLKWGASALLDQRSDVTPNVISIWTSEYGALSLKKPPTERCGTKLIAYYLPQFHPIPENDLWWGKGFTEWRNVARAVPEFDGHYQPRLPGELGFYDLRIVDVMRRQVELAKLHGISAFCFHFYWFGGKRLLEMPLQNFLDEKSMDLPFCICWANENWTRKWDGREHEVLLGQAYSPEDDIAFIRYLKRYFDDERYLKIDGKPVLTIYRPELLPEARKTVDRWRSEIKRMGFPGIYLVATNAFEFDKFREFGFDACSEFPPHGISAAAPSIRDSTKFTRPHTGDVYSYSKVVDSEKNRGDATGVVFPGVMPGWDNSPRRPSAGYIFHGSSPRLFHEWLDHCIKRARRNKPEERFVFINAWNEWAESAYLEPDQRYGYAYLAACATAVRDNAEPDRRALKLLEERRSQFKPQNADAIVLHLFYEELTTELAAQIKKFGKVDVYVTVCDDISFETAERVVAAFDSAYIQEVRNHGRDILPFLQILPRVRASGYQFVCKLHTKKSPHRTDGDDLRDMFVRELLSKKAKELLNQYRGDKSAGIFGLRNSFLSLSDPAVRAASVARLSELGRRLGIPVKFDEDFVAGSMFWFRPEALDWLQTLSIDETEFEPELGQVDGTMAHAIERFFCIAAKAAGFSVNSFTRCKPKVDVARS